MRPTLIFWPLVGLMILSLTDCGGVPASQEARVKADDRACELGEQLLLDTDFSRGNVTGSPWALSQHSGVPSFSVTALDGVLEISRTNKEPWTILYQAVTSESFSGAKVRFSAFTKGDAPSEPKLHGFEHKAGLYLRVGQRRDSFLADHQPNNGTWDWQETTVERFVPEGEQQLRVGFLHQSGGSLWVKDPTLMIIECGAR